MFEFISQLTQPVLKTIQTIFLSLALFSGADPTPTIINNPVQEIDLTPIHQEINNLGANISALADFRSSLASEITSSATSMTLESFTSGSDSLTVGKTYGFKLGGREYVIGEASTGNTIINMTRGVSRGTGTSTVSAYQSRWGRGASVEMTDAPILIRTANILGGVQTIENVLKYDSTVATTTIDDDNKNLVNYELLTYTAFNGAGVINASATQKGVVELATQIETASSTANGSAGILAIPASNATSTYNSATAPLRVVVTQNNGKIDNNFIATSSLLTNISLGTTTFIGSFPAYNIGKNIQVVSTTGTSTFTVPSGITKVKVQLVGAGAGGASGVENNRGGSGGGAGGYSMKYVDVSATTSIQVFVGSGGAGGSAGQGSPGTWTTFGTNGFYLYATGGQVGSLNNGGGGGTGVGGDLNTQGGGGVSMEDNGVENASGAGGNSFFGAGAPGLGSSPDTVGISGGNYGGGGGGGVGDNGGQGGQGVIVIEW